MITTNYQHLESEGETYVFIPGFGCNHESFKLLLNEIDTNNKNIYIINNRINTDTSDFTLRDLAKDVIELMDETGNEKFHLIGTSMGGFIAQILASSYHDRLLSLSLLCTLGNKDDFHPIKIYSEQELTEFQKVPSQKAIPFSTEKITHQETVLNKDTFNKIVQIRIKNRCNLEDHIKQMKAVKNFFSSDHACIDYQKINVPSLILSGDNDRFVSPKNINILNKYIPHAKNQLIKNTDHLFFMEKPKEVAKALNHFWEEIK
tara:strand:+ start:10395 stop:11177 length:783 start_codon:yes stop_codon:yes gene_type:complete